MSERELLQNQNDNYQKYLETIYYAYNRILESVSEKNQRVAFKQKEIFDQAVSQKDWSKYKKSTKKNLRRIKEVLNIDSLEIYLKTLGCKETNIYKIKILLHGITDFVELINKLGDEYKSVDSLIDKNMDQIVSTYGISIDESSFIRKNSSEQNEIEVPYKESVEEFNFVTDDFDNQNQVETSYDVSTEEPNPIVEDLGRQDQVEILNNVSMEESNIILENLNEQNQNEISNDISIEQPNFSQGDSNNQNEVNYTDKIIEANVNEPSSYSKKQDNINLSDIPHLYGLALDILIIMMIDQYVEIKQTSDNITLKNITGISVQTDKIKHLFERYSVNNIDDLINAYDNIRNIFYNFCQHLDDKQIQEFLSYKNDYINFKSTLINDEFLKKLLVQEKFLFSPTKEELFNLINSRIMNGINYKKIDITNFNYNNIETLYNTESYIEILKYYKNLTKNMNVEDIKKLYYIVISEYDSKEIINIENIKIMQRIFCEIIFEKNKMQCLDKSYEDTLEDICVNVLNTGLKF